MPQQQQTDRWAQYADPGPVAQSADRWAQYAELPTRASGASEPESGADTLSDVGGTLTGAVAPQESAFGELVDMGRLLPSLIHARMIGTDPKLAYKYHEYIKGQLSSLASDFSKRVSDAATVKDDPLYMLMKHKGPEPFESHDMLLNFIHDVSEFAGDPALYGPAIAGTLLGSPRLGAAGGFALDAALRKTLTDHYQKGGIKNFGELATRTSSALWEAAKGAVIGEAMGLAGGLPVPQVVGKLGATALRGIYQASAMEIAGSILNWHAPSLESFERNAVMVGGFGLITHGVSSVIPDSKQALMDVYAKDGTKPEETATKIAAQPPIKPEMKQGLQPAIKLTAKDGSEQVISGDDPTHSDLAQRVTGDKPVTIDELNADPKLADKVLNQPEIQVQQVIDRAMELKGEPDAEASVSGPDDKSYLQRPSEPPKSGRGFQTIDGKFLNRKQAERWVKENEPDVHEMWQQIAGKKGEFHSADYMEASKRVADRNLMEGEPRLANAPKELTEWYAKNRSSLNEVRSRNKGDSYGNEVVRTTLSAPANRVRVTGEQYVGKIEKLLPDTLDQEALSFKRDYRGDEGALRSDIEEIRNGTNERLKRAIPAMERALEPLTPAMDQADKLTTEWLTQANDLRTTFTGATSSIDPSRYSPRMYAKLIEDADERSELGVGQGTELKGKGMGKYSKRSPHDLRRAYLHTLDPLKEGDTVARTFNSIDGLRVYNDRLASSVARGGFEMELKNTELGKEGGRIIEDTTTGEETIQYPRDWVSLTGTRKGLHVPPWVAEAIEPILAKDALTGSKLFKAARYAQGIVKSFEVGLIPFHLRAMGLTFMNNAKLTTFWKGMGDTVNSPRFEAQERKWANWNLTTSKTSRPYEAYRGMQEDSLDRHSMLVEAARGVYKPVDSAVKGMTHLTFDIAQRYFKVTDASGQEASWLSKHPDATEAEYGKAMRSIAKQVNSAYGGLNWEVMGVNPTFLAISRFFMLAPDWTFSNLAGLKYATFEGRTPAGNASRIYLTRSFATGYAMTQGMSLAITGQMSKHWNQVYLGKDDNGKEMYSKMFFAGLPNDMVTLGNRLATDGYPRGIVTFGAYKLGPLAGTAARLYIDRDWQGKPIDKKGDDFLSKSGKQTAFAAEQLAPIPFTGKDLYNKLNDPDQSLTYKDFLAGIVGASVYHEGAKQGKGMTLPGASGGSKRKGFHLAGAR